MRHHKGRCDMSSVALRHKETLLIEILLSGLDIRSTAGAAESPMLAYLADLLVKRAREELEALGSRLEPQLGSAND